MHPLRARFLIAIAALLGAAAACGQTVGQSVDAVSAEPRGGGGRADAAEAGAVGGADASDLPGGVLPINVSPSSVQFMGWSGQSRPPEAASVKVTTYGGRSLVYETSVMYREAGAAADWLSLRGDTAPGTLSLAPTTADLAPGTYGATVWLTPATTTTRTLLSVSYTLKASALTVDPNRVVFDVDADSAPTPAVLDRVVMTGTTGAALDWTATTSVPWLSVTPAGSTGTSALLRLIPAQLDALAGGPHGAEVTFTFSRRNVPAAKAGLPVTVNLSLPRINFVAPYVALPDSSQEVILRGSGLSSARGLPVTFGASVVAAYRVVNNTEIRVKHPPLAPGSYPVRIGNQLGLPRTRATLVVKPAPALGYAVLPTSLLRHRTVYDAERIAVYTANVGASPVPRPGDPPPPGEPRVERHRLVAGAWVTDALAVGAPPEDMAIAPDGRELVVMARKALFHLDLDGWSPSARVELAAASTSTHPVGDTATFRGIAMSNDGMALVLIEQGSVSPYGYDVRTRTFERLRNAGLDSLNGSGRPQASLDGSKILVEQTGYSGNSIPLYCYDASVALFRLALRNRPGAGSMSYDRTATNAIIGGTLYDATFAPLGYHADLKLSVISPDGTRGYGFVVPTPPETGVALRIFDLTRPDGVSFRQLGSTIQIPDAPGAGPSVAVTPDGRAVFISGDRKLIVQPVP